MPAPSKLSPRAAATRDAILRAARTCFAQGGLAATTTRAIASCAGVTQPLVHHYFGSKDALFDAVLEASVIDYTVAQTEQWSLPIGDIRFFTRGLEVMFDWLSEHRDVLRLSAWARLEGRAWQHPPSAVDITNQVRARLEHFRETGMLRPGVDPGMIMLGIEALFKGYWERHDEITRQAPSDYRDLDGRFSRQWIRIMLVGAFVPDVVDAALQDWSTEDQKPLSS